MERVERPPLWGFGICCRYWRAWSVFAHQGRQCFPYIGITVIEFLHLTYLNFSLYKWAKESLEQLSDLPETTQLLVRKVGLEPELPVRLAHLFFTESLLLRGIVPSICGLRASVQGCVGCLLHKSTCLGHVQGWSLPKEGGPFSHLHKSILWASNCPLETNVA